MSITRRRALQLTSAAAVFGLAGSRARADDAANGGEILRQWYKVVLHLVRHTATYSPPVASRAFAYLGVAAYQAVASGSTSLVSLAGQLNGLKDAAAARSREDLFGRGDHPLRHGFGGEDLLRQHRPHRPARHGGGREEAEGRCAAGASRRRRGGEPRLWRGAEGGDHRLVSSPTAAP